MAGQQQQEQQQQPGDPFGPATRGLLWAPLTLMGHLAGGGDGGSGAVPAGNALAAALPPELLARLAAPGGPLALEGVPVAYASLERHHAAFAAFRARLRPAVPARCLYVVPRRAAMVAAEAGVDEGRCVGDETPVAKRRRISGSSSSGDASSGGSGGESAGGSRHNESADSGGGSAGGRCSEHGDGRGGNEAVAAAAPRLELIEVLANTESVERWAALCRGGAGR